MMTLRLFAVLALAIVAAVPAAAQDPQPAGATLKLFNVRVLPVDVVVGPDRAIWILDQQGGLSRFKNGQLQRVLRGEPGFDPEGYAVDLAVDGYGRFVYAAEGEGSIVLRRVTPAGRVREFPVAKIYAGGRDARETVESIEAGPDGTIWFAYAPDRLEHRLSIGKLTLDGKLRTYEIPRRQLGYPSGWTPTDIAIGADGDIWFTAGDGVGHMTRNGTFKPMIPVTGLGTYAPKELARGSDDAMWMDAGAGDIARLDSGGKVTMQQLGHEPDFDTYSYDVMALEIEPAPHAAVWALWGYYDVYSDATGAERVTGLNASGYVFEQLVHTREMPGRFGLAVDVDGRLWTPERAKSRIVALRPPGDQRAPAGRARIVRARRIGRHVMVQLGCTGPTGGYCTGKLRLRVRGRAVSRPARYAISAAPAQVRSRSARWIPLTHTVRRQLRRGAALSVVGPHGKRRVGR